MSRSSVLIRINGNAENFKRSLDQVKKETKTLEASLKTVATRGAIAFAGLGAGIAGAVSQAAKFETINTQFEVLVGNTEDAQRALEDLKNFSAGTPFQFEDIARAGKTLLGFGFQAEELRDRLQQIGDVSAAVGKPLSELSVIFGQVSAAGRLTGERLNQLVEAGVPIGAALAKTLNVPKEAIRDLVSRGQIDFATFEKAFLSLSQKGGVAFQALQKQSETTAGQFSTLKDNVSLLVADFGNEFLPVAKSVVASLTSFIRLLRENKAATKFAAVVIGVSTAVAGLVTVLASVGFAIVKLKAVMAAAGVAAKLLFANPIGLAIAAVVALGVAIFKFRREISASFGAAKDVVFEFVSTAGKNLRAFGKILAGIATFNVSKIKEGFNELTNLTQAGINAADTFSKGYAQRMEAFKEEEKARQEELSALRLEKQAEENELALEQKAAFRAAQIEQKIEFDEAETAAEQKRLQDQGALKEKALNADIKLEKKTDATIAKNKKKNLDVLTNQEEEFFSTTASLSRSSNKTLFNIGKAASLAQSIINTAEGASKALAQGGIVGPALAAAVTAAGAVQIATIQSQTFQAASGFSGSGSAFGESFVSTFTPREIVVPERFSEGIKKGEYSLSKAGQGSGSMGGQVEVVIGFTDNAFEIIEQKLIEGENLGISRRG